MKAAVCSAEQPAAYAKKALKGDGLLRKHQNACRRALRSALILAGDQVS